MSSTLAAIEARARAWPNRPPAPVITKAVAEQMHKDIKSLLHEIERLRAAP